MVEIDFSPEDQVVTNPHFARFGRPIASGTYEAVVAAHEFKTTKSGKNEGAAYPCIVFQVTGDEKRLPEGPVKVNFNAIVKTYAFTNLLEVFAPELLKVKGKIDHAFLDSLVGRPCKIVVENQKAVLNGDGTERFKARVQVSKVLPDAAKKCLVPTAFKSEVDPFDQD